MNLSKKGIQVIDSKLPTSRKSTTLNPDAAEFIPLSLRSPPAVCTVDTDASAKFSVASGSTGKAVINRTESAVLNNSDDEAHQFWRHQLPDDITPNFKVMDENVSQGIGGLSLAGLSLCDDSDASRFSASPVGGFPLSERQELLPDQLTLSCFATKLRYGGSSMSEDTSPGRLLSSNPWDKPIVNNDLIFGSSREAAPFKGSSKPGFGGDVFIDRGVIDRVDTASHLEFLGLNFPGFAADSLAEVYYANGCDLNMTIEMLTRLELQSDGAFSPNLNLKPLSAPNPSAMNFPALSSPEGQSLSQKNMGDELQPPSNFTYRSPEKGSLLKFKSGSSAPFQGAIDFASAVKKVPAPESSIWKCERNGSANATIGTSRSSQTLAGSYHSGIGRASDVDRVPNRTSARAAPVWLETGVALANLYSELREEARDHARLRNAYFEQARQAYLVSNKALAKQLSIKGQSHSMHIKAAHGKAQESIYRQRHPVPLELQGDGRGKERMIDLHGLHVSEAILVLKSELGVLRAAARDANRCLQVYICVGTGHHTWGSRTPARLPVAVRRYLLEEEGLEYSEPQPGLLQVLIS